jgi:anti-sigma regulatory factor (Ser/Thr protein kinase)
MSSHTVTIELESELVDVRRARRWLTRQLEGWDQDAVDVAVLLTSELVTNSFLYAAPPVSVLLVKGGRTLRVEVCDGSPAPPLWKQFGPTAATGRGLELVDRLASSWGTGMHPGGKSVWFELDPEAPGHGPSRHHLSDAAAAAAAAAAPPPAPPEGWVRVRILDLPLSVYSKSEAQNDALLREFALISRDAEPPQVPSDLLVLVAELQSRFSFTVSSARAQISAALERGDETVELAYDLPLSSRDLVIRLNTLLDQADEFCRRGGLLTLAASPDVVAFRQWYLAQVLAQMDGLAPSSWEDGRAPGNGS